MLLNGLALEQGFGGLHFGLHQLLKLRLQLLVLAKRAICGIAAT